MHPHSSSRWPLALVALSALACDTRTPARLPAAPNAASATAGSLQPEPVSATTASTGTSPTSTDAEVLAVGEAVVVPGSVTVETDSPSGEAINFIGFPGSLVVIGQTPGTSQIHFRDSDNRRITKTFSVVAELCRDTPLHPAIVLGVEAHANLRTGPVRRVEIATHSPWIAAVNLNDSANAVRIFGQHRGQTTLIVVQQDGAIKLWDVFVGGHCSQKGYASVTAAVGPGMLGPKGDGSCVRRRTPNDPGSAEPCPNRSSLQSLPDAELSPLACDWAGSCARMGDEGCCVGCNNPFAVKLTRACATKIVSANTCAAVQQLWDGPGCFR